MLLFLPFSPLWEPSTVTLIHVIPHNGLAAIGIIMFNFHRLCLQCPDQEHKPQEREPPTQTAFR